MLREIVATLWTNGLLQLPALDASWHILLSGYKWRLFLRIRTHVAAVAMAWELVKKLVKKQANVGIG
jgi:hypothetical protein